MNNSWKIAVAFIVVFLAGGATGAIFTLKYAKPPPPVKPATPPEQFAPKLMQRWLFSNRLDLTPAQRAKLRPIAEDAAEDLRRLNREEAHSAILIIEHMQDQIAAELTPDQRNKFNDLIENTRQQMMRWVQNHQRQELKQQVQQQGR